jgi:hypothetical protein
LAPERRFRQFSIGIKDKLDGFTKILARFFERIALGVGTWKLFHEGDVTFGNLHVYGGQVHDSSPELESSTFGNSSCPAIIGILAEIAAAVNELRPRT